MIPLAKLQNRKHNLVISLENNLECLPILIWFGKREWGLIWVSFYGGVSMPEVLFGLCRVSICVKGEGPVKISSNVV